MFGAMIVYALFAAMLVLIVATILIAAGVSALIRRFRTRPVVEPRAPESRT
jgi:hypothetical protein